MYYVGMCMWLQVSEEARSIISLWSWVYKQLWVTYKQQGCWELDMGSLEEQHLFLTAGPSLQAIATYF